MIASKCRQFVATPLIIWIVLLLISLYYPVTFWISCLFLLLTVFTMFFFRDPKRKIADGIVSAADGRVMEIKNIGNFVRIATFMNIHNVHVNRAPITGIVKSIEHFVGPHDPVYKKDAEKNEKVVTLLKTEIGEVKIVQIAGLVARRIVSYIKKGQKLKKGDKIGIIRLGSRVDVYLPKNKVNVVVKVGDKIKAGETTIAVIKSYLP